MSHSNKILARLNRYSELDIIDAQRLYQEKFNDISEQAFFKTLSRLAKDGEIQRLTKGIYCKPKKGRFGIIGSNEKNILEYYVGTNKNKGVVVGYQMYNKYGLTTQVSKIIEVYSNVTLQEKRKIKNVSIYKANLKFDASTKKMIELLEVLENYHSIEDLSSKSMLKFITDARSYYNEKTLEKLLKTIGYKKSTLASLRNLLDELNIENTVDQYLNGTSKYKALRLEDLYEAAS